MGNTHIYAQTSKLVTDAVPPPWLQSITMLTSIISCHLSSIFLSCLLFPFCSPNMFFMIYSSTPSVSAPSPSLSTSLWTTELWKLRTLHWNLQNLIFTVSGMDFECKKLSSRSYISMKGAAAAWSCCDFTSLAAITVPSAWSYLYTESGWVLPLCLYTNYWTLLHLFSHLMYTLSTEHGYSCSTVTHTIVSQMLSAPENLNWCESHFHVHPLTKVL